MYEVTSAVHIFSAIQDEQDQKLFLATDASWFNVVVLFIRGVRIVHPLRNVSVE